MNMCLSFGTLVAEISLINSKTFKHKKFSLNNMVKERDVPYCLKSRIIGKRIG